MENSVKIEGFSNYKKPKQDFADKLAAKSDKEYLQSASDTLWLSAYANNNPRSDYHWKADVCYDEAMRRGNPQLYRDAYRYAYMTAGHGDPYPSDPKLMEKY